MCFKRVWKDIHKNENSNYLQRIGLWMDFLSFFLISQFTAMSMHCICNQNIVL